MSPNIEAAFLAAQIEQRLIAARANEPWRRIPRPSFRDALVARFRSLTSRSEIPPVERTPEAPAGALGIRAREAGSAGC